MMDDKQAREKMDGPTPRTDALGDQPMTIGDITPPFPVLAKWESLARQLEREVESLSAQVAAQREEEDRLEHTLALVRMDRDHHYERAEAAEAQVAELKKDAERLDRLDARADDWTYKNQKAWSFRCAAHLSLREALDFIAAKESGVSP